MISECPPVYASTASTLSRLLGLGAWKIAIREADQPGGGGMLGVCSKDARTLEAVITLKRDMPEAERLDTLVHELLHVALARMDQAVEDRIVELLPEALHDHARGIYNDALEATVVTLTRAIVAQGVV